MFGSCFLTPIFGKLIDSSKNLIFFLKISIVLIFLAFLTSSILPLMDIVHFYALIPFSLILLFLSITPAIIWPLYSTILEPELLGIAASVTYFITNLGYFINPIIFGTIHDIAFKKNTKWAYPSSLMYLAMVIVSCFWFAHKLSDI